MEHRIYESFAKIRAEIERMPEQTEQEQARKTKALAIWYVLKGFCFDNNP